MATVQDRNRLCSAEETSREALGRFLRERRETIAPEQVGISSRRGRRTPGLRREEVAFLADIGAKWYARLEAGHEINPSEATLTGIAVALHLSSAELEYMLELAGLRHRSLPSEEKNELPEPMPALLRSLHGVAALVTDRILTPLCWNALADAIYGLSRYDNPVDRNALVRSLFDSDFIAFLGLEHEEFVSRAVGMFRLNYSSRRQSPFAPAVYEKVKDHPLFQRVWNRRIIFADLWGENVIVRDHPVFGALRVYAIDFNATIRPGLILRTVVPADEETARKFGRLEGLGMEQPAYQKSRLTDLRVDVIRPSA
jgi:transcriptional regulator with XRE-family HTH domain